ncbi:hypothetical protein [Variovorax sp. PBL-H6]|uniref:hypothetical protein n=1 Tax=Variovorax sp. PBL-H6 TaxID=434009 RepID=UPI0013A58796|nr:hypothetical protein [Variovorax sp. PBL-H6]
MNFIESRLLGVRVDEMGREASLSINEKSGARFDLELHGVERLWVNELRQQNIIEDMVHWTAGEATADLREAAFFLMTGVAERDCGVQLAQVASTVVDRVVRSELEMLEITAVFGAQVIASFASMTVRLKPST